MLTTGKPAQETARQADDDGVELVCRTCGAVVHFVKGRWSHEQDPDGCPMLIVAWPEGRTVDDDEAA